MYNQVRLLKFFKKPEKNPEQETLKVLKKNRIPR